MTAVVPGMQARADDLRDRLTELAAIRRRMDKQSAALVMAEQDAATARQDLDRALTDKAMAERQKRAAAAREAAAIARLVREARDLRDLARRLKKRPGADVPVPARGAFGKARGTVPLPVAGTVDGGYGEADDGGTVRRGLAIAARPGAQVTAPYDGRVLYSGPFRQYGGIVILGVAGGYQMILAGLAETSAYVGQDILAGEPIGRLADDNRQLGSSSSGRSQLYMELRFDGEPIDPSPWLKQAG